MAGGGGVVGLHGPGTDERAPATWTRTKHGQGPNCGGTRLPAFLTEKQALQKEVPLKQPVFDVLLCRAHLFG